MQFQQFGGEKVRRAVALDNAHYPDALCQNLGEVQPERGVKA